LNLDEVRHFRDFPDMTEKFANPFPAGVRLRHVAPRTFWLDHGRPGAPRSSNSSVPGAPLRKDRPCDLRERTAPKQPCVAKATVDFAFFKAKSTLLTIKRKQSRDALLRSALASGEFAPD
jgi:hypothetical protein